MAFIYFPVPLCFPVTPAEMLFPIKYDFLLLLRQAKKKASKLESHT